MSYTVTYHDPMKDGNVRLVEVVFTQTADGSGDASETTSESFVGKVVQVTTDPDGTAVPAANWDLYLQDADGGDIISTDCENQSDTLVTGTRVNPPGWFQGTLTAVMDNAGSGGKAVSHVWIVIAE